MAKRLGELLTEHIPYEIRMMRFAMFSLLENRQRCDLEQNALIEAFCLHARTLIEFFKDKYRFGPIDFTVPGFRLQKRFIGDSALARLNEQVAHLTERRRTKIAEKINVAEMQKMLRDIEAEIERFGRHLKPEHQTAWGNAVTSERPHFKTEGTRSGMHAVTTTTSASVSSQFRMRPLRPSGRESS
jgi:hypothetical protein